VIKRIINTVHLIIILSLFINFTYFAQAKTNLEIVKSLVNSSVKDLAENIKINSKEFEVKFIAANDYSILQTELLSDLQKNGFILFNKNESKNENLRTLTYTLDNAKVDYKNIFKDGILGVYLVERKATLNGSYFIEDNNKLGKVKEFNYSLLDTVLYDDIKTLDNIAYQFTSAELPDEPFFSSLLEPTIAIGTAAIAVYLFFNIRSK
jgi:hypothetical protein